MTPKSIETPIELVTDEDLTDCLSRLREGDQAAVVAIYRRFYGSLTAFVRLHVDDSAAVEEIVDDTFMVVFSNPTSFQGRSSFKTWLFGIAKNRCHDWLRQAKRQPAIGAQDDQTLLDGLVDPAWPALDQLEQAQVNTIIHRCLQRLSEVHRQVLFWVFFEEMSMEQVALEQQCAAGTVKSRLFHAKSKLAECVGRRLNDGVA
ncbi:RNA polymerase sigma factor [Orrella daihaiensis]|uniref:RNA polymerase sigma factor n=1 Tax=Orrella daihaiensis TaxID=2782176 RepID=A0ABY4AJA6_9BURK|nr:RNA polymerase sigma factor [Orrella daihaiensis]UOD50370.1 RNA polymerase sigma factor [Orrella daihaiensis]